MLFKCLLYSLTLCTSPSWGFGFALCHILLSPALDESLGGVRLCLSPCAPQAGREGFCLSFGQ